ncbi:MAG: phenylalanine--tRNA ligase subunit alpha [Prevotellaceae bacterium]|jgi:phenylalanyl-tRNA synthetase alpha chain|nr:phenylalanine--tRNA ligase subunit alpha [Prevotellaceae bacterium]
MRERIEQLLKEVEQFSTSSIQAVEEFRIKMLGKKGDLTQLFEEFKQISGEAKREFGQKINHLKKFTQDKINELKTSLESSDVSTSQLDTTRPGTADRMGTRHPVSIIQNELLAIFGRLGFTVADGPEVEDDWHVFGALNFPPDHPARDMQDTFFISKKEGDDNPILLRTHTSSIQVRAMENSKPPIRIVCPGRVFRNEAVSARAHCMFHQVEGLYVDENVSFADLKQTLLYFVKELFGSNVEIRLRPSFFPFTEPSAEMDISCTLCGGKGCNVCKYTGWLEVGGCGMVDPNVLESCKIDSKKYNGFAFGMGVERIVMLKYQVRDLRLYFENDVRFLNQFQTVI